MGVSYGKNRCLNIGHTAARAGERTAGPVRQRSIAFARTLQPLVSHRGTDPKPPAKFPPIDSLRQSKMNKLAALIHNRYLVPWHG
jgi:hypothetical protein